ncbi:MAG: flagellar biosynthetic protein FliR, partial [Pseudomonadota bacterium]
SLTMLPWLSQSLPAPLELGPMMWWFTLMRESFIGIVIGYCGGLPIWAAEMGGRFLDSTRGQTMAQLGVPQVQIQSSLFGDFYFQLMIVLYMAMGGHRIFLSVVFDTYFLFPPFGPGPQLLDNGLAFIEITAQLFVFAIKLIAPGLVAVIFLDLVLGIANRMAPQLNVYFLSMSIKSTLATLAIAVSIYFILPVATEWFTQSHQWMYETLREATPGEPGSAPPALPDRALDDVSSRPGAAAADGATEVADVRRED